MRRFEFTEGTSNKFWEITVSGTEVTTQWGRIGTDGQTKSKDLGTDDKAANEAEKQIKAKAKKGYVEVGAAAAAKATVAKAAAAPKKAVAPKEAKAAPEASKLPDEDTFTVPSSWKAKVHSRRGGAFVPTDRHEAAKQLLRATDPADGGQRKALASFRHDAFSSLTETQLTQVLARMRSKHSWGEDRAADAFVRAMLGAFDLTTVVRAYLTTEPVQRGWRLASVPALLWLRRAIAAADDAGYQAALAVAAEVREGPTLQAFQRLRGKNNGCEPDERLLQICAYLFPDTGWWRTLPNPGGVPCELATAADTAAEAAPLLAHHWGLMAGVLETLAVEHGSDAVPLITPFLDADADAGKYAARVLLEMPYDEAMGALLDHLDHKAVASVIGTAAARYPQRALRLALERRGQSAVAPLLRGWAAQYPAAVDAVAGGLDDDARDALAALREELSNALPDADPSTLHPLFFDPPWGRKKQPKRIKPMALSADLPPNVFDWSEEDKVVLARLTAEVEELLKDPARVAKQVQVAGYDLALQIAALRVGGPAHLKAQQNISSRWFHAERAHQLVVGLYSLTDDADLATTLIRKADAKDAWAYLPAVACPQVAWAMLDSLSTKTRRAHALEWMERHPAYAARAWVPHALGRPTRWQREALAALRRLVDLGHGQAVEDGARVYGDHVAAAWSTLLTMDPLDHLPAKRPKTIGFWLPAALPRPQVKGQEAVLSLSQVEVAAMMLAMSPLDDPYAGVEVLKETCEPRSLAAFGWALFEQWLAAGAPSKEGWALTQLGLLGDDAIAGDLTPKIRRWPGEGQHKRAVAGLDVLLAIGSDVALMHLNGIAQKVKFKGVKEQARQRIQRLAVSLGLTKDQLADRLVPDLGLSKDGTLALDYGPRQFVVSFDESLKPVVREAETGKVRKSLPKPGAKDDEEKAPEAEARFKQLKKDVRTLARLQIARLESAMVVGRRWTSEDFATFLARHPLLGHLVRRLIWGVYDGDGGLVHSFRVAEDGCYADAEDEETTLPAGEVGLLHPIDADGAVLAAWGEVLSDYELLQPFVQLGRPVVRLSAEHAGSKLYPCDEKRLVPIGRVLGLMSRGWERGEAQDAGVSHWLSMPLPDGEHEVRLWLGAAGIWTGMGGEQDDDPSIQAISVVKRNHWSWKEEGVKAFGELPGSLVSEVLGTVERLYAE